MNQPKKIVNPYNKYIFSTKVSLVVAIVTLVIAVIAMTVTEYTLKHIDHLQAQVQQQAQSMHHTFSANQLTLNHLTQQSEYHNQQLKMMNQRITHQFEHSDRQWVEQAQRQLQLTQLLLTTQLNTTTSIQRLTTAQQAISQLPSTFYEDANTTISHIIDQLKKAKTLDVNATINRIHSLREMISSFSVTPENQKQLTVKSTPLTSTSYWNTSKHVIERLFTIRYHAVPVSPIQDPEQGQQLRQYLLLKVSELEWALLNNDDTFYQQNLQTIQQQINSIVMNQHNQQAIIKQLKSLQAIQFGFPRSQIISQIETLLTTLSSPPHSASQPTPSKATPSPKPAASQKINPAQPLPSIEV